MNRSRPAQIRRRKDPGSEIIRCASKRQARHLPQRADDRRTHGNVGHEMSVHHVDVDAVRAGSLSLGHLIAQAGEIGREDRRSELYA